jgi:deoxyribodipyrimidine photo-lyase
MRQLKALSHGTGLLMLFLLEIRISHEETEPGWSYVRDVQVGTWCKTHRIPWQEFTQTGVVRRLRNRTGWAKRWQARMDVFSHAGHAGELCQLPPLAALATNGLVLHVKVAMPMGTWW